MTPSHESIECRDIPVAHPEPFGMAIPAGYPALANRIGQYPQFGIFRSFGGLMAKNLLYYQAELQHLEHELKKLEWRDSNGKITELYAGDWERLSSAAPPNNQQYQKVLYIRGILKEYCTF
jgi:hypothetical protein